MKTRTKLTAITALVAGALMVGVPAASAAVTFDPDTGTGFVGKGDVQTAFVWNNKDLQANAGGVTFSYEATETYEAVCTFVTGGGMTQNVPRERVTAVEGSVAYDARSGKQITGFLLTGLGDTTETGAVPVVGGFCSGGPNGGTWTSVELVSSVGGLFVEHGGTSVQLTF